ncbi:MAG: SPFH domain-containing protein [Acidimicrobiia bacterium]|nr:SPFH domain-containing protein [Acidimicrobiia bacterium]MDX2466287.1 SPFH domain-containing protein [Acidimicrobiia bacterium]
MELLITVAGLLVLAIVVVVLAVKSFIVICPPNQIAVITGRAREMPDGTSIGYRVLRGGRTLRWPVIEKVQYMDLNTIAIEVSVQNAYSKGAIPLNVQGIANVKLSSREGLLENSMERFLGRPAEYIPKLAKETLEANLRGVLATLTPEEVNEDRLKFAQTLIDEADDDIKTLGLELDVLKIQNVTDEVGYLDSVGRRQTAAVLKEARIAEALRQTEAEEAEADARKRTEIARVQANLAVVERQNELRVRTAELEKIATAKEAEASVEGDRARVVAEQELELARIQLQQNRLEADVIAPARAKREAMELEAKGAAASIIEDGQAQIEVFQRLVEQYNNAGDDAEQIFVLNMLPDIIDKIVSTVRSVNIDKVSVIDGGNGSQQIPGLLSQLPGSVIRLTEQIENATGVNILSGLGARTESAETPAAE